MIRTVLTVLLLATIAAPAGADVTIKQTNTGKGMGMSGTMPSTTYIKGLKMRTETVMGDTTRVTIFDVDEPEDVLLRLEEEGSRTCGTCRRSPPRWARASTPRR